MRSPAVHLILAIYLTLGLTGAVTALAEVADGDCCSDCEDPGCPEEQGQSCPPQCDDCVCPCWTAPINTVTLALEPQPRQAARYSTRFTEITREPPPPRGVFRPPRASV